MCKLPKFSDPNLLVGFDTSDDASVYKLSDDTAVVQTVDIFPPVADDPYDFGRIAAANALSDVYAMGANPKLALNIFCYPQDFPLQAVEDILRGGYDKVAEAGAMITGGHTIKDPIPKYGLAVTGFAHPKDIRMNNGVFEGDVLILTKPIGVGVLNSATKAGLISDEGRALAVETMAALNKRAFELSKDFNIHASTDVTGFGLLGHALEMVRGTGLSLGIDSKAVPVLSGALDFAGQDVIPGGAYNNLDYVEKDVSYAPSIEEAYKMLLADPQTSGGLLLALEEKEGNELLKRLSAELPSVGIIGCVSAKKEKLIEVK